MRDTYMTLIRPLQGTKHLTDVHLLATLRLADNQLHTCAYRGSREAWSPLDAQLHHVCDTSYPVQRATDYTGNTKWCQVGSEG